MIRLNEKNCNDCGICYDVCPDFVFARSEDGHVTLAYPEHCCSCGHCISLCPVDALSHPDLPAEEFHGIEGPVPGPAIVRNLMLQRRSIRAYKEKQVPREIIEELIHAGSHAGSGGNIQNETFTVITDPSTLETLELMVIDELWNMGMKFFSGKGLMYSVVKKQYGETLAEQYQTYHHIISLRRKEGKLGGMIFRKAPALLLVHGLKRNNMAYTNAAIALRNIELMALAHGLGSCWCGFLMSVAAARPKKINDFLNAGPDNHKIFGALMLGYPKYKYKKTVPRTKRKIQWIER